MLLGTLLNRLREETGAAATLVTLGDLVLGARVEQAAAAEGESPGAYAALATERFAQRAGDEDWLVLMGVMERAHDPAAACLAAMLRWALDHDAPALPGDAARGACTCGGGRCDGGR